MSIDKFFAHSKIKRLITIPEDLRVKIFGSDNLTTDEKFMLANLYYLDSKRKLPLARKILPLLTGYSDQECEQILVQLSKKQLIWKQKNNIHLRVKPIRYLED